MTNVVAVVSSVVITATPLPNAEVLELSLENEALHAIERGRMAMAADFPAGTNVVSGMVSGLDASAAARKLVSLQRGDGRWMSGTNDVTLAVIMELERLVGDPER